MYKLVLDNLEKQPGWIVESGPTINEPVPVSFTFQQTTEALIITNTGVANAAALCAFKVPFPALPVASMPWIGIDLDCMVLDASLPLLRCLEIDLKVAQTSAPAGGTLANVMDGSGQYNVADGFWQIDTAGPNPVWTNTAYKPTPLKADLWTRVSTRYQANWPSKTASVLSAKIGNDQPAPFPASNNPLLVTNWNDVIALQLQTCLMKSGTLVVYYRNIRVTISDTAF